jgi:hypothetical protein
MALAGAGGTAVARMQVGFVHDLEARGLQSLQKLLADARLKRH